VKDYPIFPLSHKALVTCCSLLAVGSFLFLFFLSPPVPEYSYGYTEKAEVIAIRSSSNSRINRGSVSADVKLETGGFGIVDLPTRHIIFKGDIIDVDVLEADGEKPRYRLAQTPVQP